MSDPSTPLAEEGGVSAAAADAEAQASGDIEADEFAGSAKPLESGEAPEGFTIKGNKDSMKFHVPGSRWYASTRAEVWFDTKANAEAAGFAPAGGAAAQKIDGE